MCWDARRSVMQSQLSTHNPPAANATLSPSRPMAPSTPTPSGNHMQTRVRAHLHRIASHAMLCASAFPKLSNTHARH